MTDKRNLILTIARYFVSVTIVGYALIATHVAKAEEADGAEADIQILEQEGNAEVQIDGELFTRFVYADTARPYLFPIIGPTGASMTRSFPFIEGVVGESRDHPHHQGLWYGHGNIDGTDYWHLGEDRGHTLLSQPPKITGAQLSAYARLVPGGMQNGVTCRLTTLMYFSVDADDTRNIDYYVAYGPTLRSHPLRFGDTKEGTMAIRLNPALRLKGDVATGHCVNSEGDTNGDCWGKRAKWIAYWGQVDGKTCGVAVFDHPRNFRHPTWWHARDYGLVAANPFGIHDFEGGPEGAGNHTIERGERFDFFYRFVFFAGTAEEADIAGKYEAWVAATMGQEED